MSRASGAFKRLFEWVKNILPILVVFGSAWWGYEKYVKTEAPSLEFHPEVSGNLHWDASTRPDSCKVDFYVNVKNSGRSSFDVSHAQVQAWEFDVTQEKSQLPILVDTDRVKREGMRFFDRSYSEHTGPLWGHYPPGAQNYYTFRWVNVRMLPPRFSLFRVDVFFQEANGVKHSVYAERWDDTCLGVKAEPPSGTKGKGS